MSAPWFHAEQVPAAGEIAHLDDREARHASGSRRLHEGDPLVLFDGCGCLADCVMLPDRASARVEAVRRVAPTCPAIHLASAIPKGDRLSTLLGMATQLGITSFTPLYCTRSVIHWTEATAARARRICLEACKQSGQAHLPDIRDPLEPVDAARPGAWIADPSGEPLSKVASDLGDEVTLLVGPEGGFTEDELTAAAHRGATRVHLGASTLRIETAAVALIATIRLP